MVAVEAVLLFIVPALFCIVGLVLCPINNASGEYSWKKAEAAAERDVGRGRECGKSRGSDLSRQ